MNERIKQLAEQADIYSDKHAESRDYVVLRDQYFAELIVRECVIQCEREWIRNGTDSAHNQAIHGCINSIKKHFGVE